MSRALLFLCACLGCLFLAAVTAGPPDRPFAEAKATLPPKTVTLTEALPLSKTLASFSQQTGIPVSNQLGSDPTLKLSLTKTRFWEALDAIADAAGGRVNAYAGDGRLEIATDLRQDKTVKLPVSYGGLGRVSLRRLVAFRDFETGAHGYTATVDVAWEPTFLALYLQTSPQQLQMLDDAGKPQKLPAEQSVSAPVHRRLALPVDIHLPALDRSAKTIGQLRGTFLLRGSSKMLTFSLGSLADLATAKKPTAKTIDRTTVMASDIKLTRQRWSIRITTKLPSGGPKFDSSQFWDVNNQIYLLSKDGKTRLAPTGYDQETAGSSPKAVLNYHFEDTPARKRGRAADWTLVYRAPASIIEVSIPFEFKNVRLP